MQFFIRRYFPVLTLLILFISAVSCSGAKGWGVVLWSTDEEKVQTGSIVPVLSHSKIEKLMVIQLPEKKGKLTIDDYRIMLFGSKKKAQDFVNTDYSNPRLFAQIEKQGHYIRSEAEVKEDNWIYRLKEGQIIKIISKLPNPIKIGSREGYWYDVLTEDGTRGYSFDTYLSIYDSKDGGPTSIDASPEEDLAFSWLYLNRWHPDYFEKMLAKNEIDADQLDPNFGFFLDKTKKTVTIILDKIRSNFQYETVLRLGNKSYLLEPANIQITVFNDESISVVFPNKGKDRAQSFSVFDKEIIEKAGLEKAKVDAKYGAIVSTGPSYSAPGYGTLSFTAYRTFTWSSCDNLKGTIIPSYASESGTLSYNLLLSSDLSGSWDGVLSLYFNGMPEDKAVYFLYKRAQNGLTLQPLSERHIDNKKATSVDSSSPTFFMTAGG